MEQVAEKSIKYISEKFVDISTHAENLAFSRFIMFHLTPYMQSLNKLQKFIFHLSHPLSTPFETQPFFYLVFLLAWIPLIFSFAIGLYLTNKILEIGLTFFTSFSSFDWILLILCIIFGVYSSLVAYRWWADTFLSKNNPWVKIVLCLLFGFLLNSITLQLSRLNHSLGFVEISIIVFSMLFLIIPSVTYMIAVFFDLFQFIVNFLFSMFNGIAAINNPHPTRQIIKLATEDILGSSSTKDEQIQQTWKLVDLPKLDIQMLLKWSKENRDGCEKRIIPTTIILAIFGILLSIQFFKDGLSQIIFNTNYFFQTFSFSSINTNTIIPMVGNILLFYLVTFFVITLIRLIRNIIAQNLVIEACIIAEYAQAQQESESLQNTCDSKPTFCRRIINFFRKSNIAK